MSETTKEPKWAADIKTAAEQWHKAKPETRSLIMVAVDANENGLYECNATIIGKHEHIVTSLEAAMFDGSKDNLPGMALRIAAMGYAMNHARITHNNGHE